MHFIAKLQEYADENLIPHNIHMSHRGLPYRLHATKVSYRVYSLSAVQNALEEQSVMKLVPTTSFRNLEPVTDGGKARSMKERIAQAKQNRNLGYTERVEKFLLRLFVMNCELQ